MKKCWIIIAALYLYPEFLVVMLPMLISWSGAHIPSAVDRWIDANYLFAAILFFLIPTLTLLMSGILFAVSSLTKPPVSPADSISLMKTQMIMRLVQVPGYVLIFVTSLLFCLAIFTFGFSLYFIILDSASIIITGLFSVPVYMSLYKNGLIGKERVICYCLLSFVFCADVIVSVRCYKQVKDLNNH